MQEINQQLFRIQGTKDPLKKIAKQYARKYRIFFLDEFIVNDACNAMILAGLLEALFSEGICLITTSNIIPDKLYEHGFPREPFLPAIESIKNNMRVINLASGMDYRRSETHTHERYLTPLTKATADELEQQFNNTLIQDKLVSTEPWIIYGRSIPVIRASDNCAWFYFHVLCEPPRSQLDYIAISKKINHLFLSNIPKLGKHSRDQASYFIQLIDVMYDAGVRLTVTAEASIDLLYCEGELISEFERTRSRLIEMCSHSK
jgi:cell division protein ZapE